MRYLGVEIFETKDNKFKMGEGTWRIPFEIERETFETLEHLKSVIKHWQLPEYKPTKTLSWLNRQGYMACYSSEKSFLQATNRLFVISYDLIIGAVYVQSNITGDDIIGSYKEYQKMSPSDFIKLINNGAWK